MSSGITLMKTKSSSHVHERKSSGAVSFLRRLHSPDFHCLFWHLVLEVSGQLPSQWGRNGVPTFLGP